MLKALDIMHRHVVGVSKMTKVSVALKLSRAANVHLLPVLEGEKLRGITFESDLEAHRDSDVPAGKIMRKPIFVDQRRYCVA